MGQQGAMGVKKAKEKNITSTVDQAGAVSEVDGMLLRTGDVGGLWGGTGKPMPALPATVTLN